MGKSSLFNALTKGNAKVANWPGVTVEKKEGVFQFDGKEVRVVDLPGAYSLTSYSVDERIARDFIIEGKPDLVVCIVDSTNLLRNLYLFLLLKELGAKVILALNMIDLAEKKLRIDVEKLEQLLSTPIVQTVANKGIGIEELKKRIAQVIEEEQAPLFVDYGKQVEEVLGKLAESLKKNATLPYNPRFVALKLLEGDAYFYEILNKHHLASVGELAQMEVNRLEKILGQDVETYLIERRYRMIEEIVRSCIKETKKEPLTLSDRIDKIVTHRFIGLLIFAIAMLITFKLTFSLGGFVADYLGSFFDFLGDKVASWLKGAPFLGSFLKDGLINGVGTVITFLPNIFFLFLFLAFLEDVGYMARAAFVMDKFMVSMGLPGRAFIPMLLGFGCNVPAIMATRVIADERDRLIAILINPFMSCTARLPIYILFTSVFFKNHHPHLVVFSLYLIGLIVAIISAKLFRLSIPSLRGKVSPLIMELPPYRMPTYKGVIIASWQRSKQFLKKAGTIIFAGVIMVWLLASIPPSAGYASSDTLIGKLGHLLAPLLKPAGFGFWQAAVALLFGLIAKETVVGTLGTLLGGEEKLPSALANLFTPLSAFSFMVMSLLYIPCLASIGAIYRETNSFRWTLFSVLWSLFIGWLLAVLFYQIGGMLL